MKRKKKKIEIIVYGWLLTFYGSILKGYILIPFIHFIPFIWKYEFFSYIFCFVINFSKKKKKCDFYSQKIAASPAIIRKET